MCWSGLYVGYVCIYANRDVDRRNESLKNKNGNIKNTMFVVTNVYYYIYSVMKIKCRCVSAIIYRYYRESGTVIMYENNAVLFYI
jgi:hypothetical protein